MSKPKFLQWHPCQKFKSRKFRKRVLKFEREKILANNHQMHSKKIRANHQSKKIDQIIRSNRIGIISYRIDMKSTIKTTLRSRTSATIFSSNLECINNTINKLTVNCLHFNKPNKNKEKRKENKLGLLRHVSV